MHLKLSIIAVVAILMAPRISAQNIFPASGNAGIYTTVPATSAALEIRSTSKGLLIPRMINIQRNNLPSPVAGLLIYQTDNTPGFYYYDGSIWKAIGASETLSNLVGPTSINQSLLPLLPGAYELGSSSLPWKNIYFSNGLYTANGRVFNVNSTNTAIGLSSLNANTSGTYNTATGYAAMNNNTTGYENTATGTYSLKNNTSGFDNTATGPYALYYNTTGSYNTAAGPYSLLNNQSGSNNMANGYFALYSNTTGTNNIATGNNALRSNTTGTYNTANGNAALYNNTTGLGNTATGNTALHNNTTGYLNSADGYSALYYNTTGDANTANGFSALEQNTSGSSNTAIGSLALEYNTTGDENTAIGDAALVSNTTGIYNTSVGSNSSPYNTTGFGNTCVGTDANTIFSNTQNSTAIGFGCGSAASNQVRLGNSSVISIGGFADWTNISDGRVKKNIVQNVPGLSFINLLKPVTYNLNLDAIDNINQPVAKKGKDGKTVMPSALQTEARKQKEQIVYTGFVAQDVEKAAKSIRYDFSGVDAAKNEKDLYGLRYSEFVVPLVKAVQELSQQNNELKKIVSGQQEINDMQQQQINELRAMIVANQSPASNQLSTIVSSALLQQNIPNPFSNNTTIGYVLPQKFTTAQITITDKNGKTIKVVNISGSGKGSLNVNASTLASGAYNYSLYVDGKLIDTKQMVLQK